MKHLVDQYDWFATPKERIKKTHSAVEHPILKQVIICVVFPPSRRVYYNIRPYISWFNGKFVVQFGIVSPRINTYFSGNQLTRAGITSAKEDLATDEKQAIGTTCRNKKTGRWGFPYMELANSTLRMVFVNGRLRPFHG